VEVIRTDAQAIAESIRNPEAFASVFDRHAEVLAKYLVRRVGPTDGESLLGELFRIAFESRDRFDTNYSDARPWLYGIGSKLVMKHFRSRKRGRTALVRLASQSSLTEVPFDEQVTENSHWIALWQCVAPAIDDLPDRDREVVILYVFSAIAQSNPESIDTTMLSTADNHTPLVGHETSRSVGDVEWLDPLASEPSAKGQRVLAGAAMFVLVALLGGLLISPFFQRDEGQLATTTAANDDEVAVATALFQIPTEPVRGLDQPVVMIDREFANGRECSDDISNIPGSALSASVALFGMSPVTESYSSYAAATPDRLTSFVDLGGSSITCDDRGWISYAAGAGVADANFGAPDALPPVIAERTGGDDDRRITIEGKADLDVNEVRLASDLVADQTFLRFDDRFRLDVVLTDPLRSDEDLQIEVFFEDGSSQTQSLWPDNDCLIDSKCLGSWFEHFADEANDAGSLAQAAALEDLVLTQTEFDNAVVQFRACLPVDLGPSIDNESSSPVRQCYETHVEFLEEARVLHNAVWMGTTEGQDRFSTLMQEQFAASIEAVTSEEFVVFMRADATIAEIQQVGTVLADEGLPVKFVSQEQTYDEFVESFASDDQLLDTISAETMPPSWRVNRRLEDYPGLAQRLEALDQVQTVILATDTVRNREFLLQSSLD